MTQTYPYTVVDVFTTEPLSGNSLAVFACCASRAFGAPLERIGDPQILRRGTF